jgi:hypothetical protein
MRVTIVREDSAVIVDGLRLEVGAVALLPKNIHAVQWDGDAKRGEIEFSYVQCPTCHHGSKEPNERMTEFKIGDMSLQPILDGWTAAKVTWDAEQKRLAALAAEEQARMAALATGAAPNAASGQ